MRSVRELADTIMKNEYRLHILVNNAAVAGNKQLVLFPLYFKGGYLDFSYLTKLKNIDITEIYMKKQYKSSITKNHII